ncbi:MAG TPA: AAA family ATPase [Streptosporangiaceae bacterium]|nr:AAA family ATPase [Streptosporangiaceae bacterium]
MRSATVLVGREAELDQLLRAVRGARAGHPSCTLVVGEGGVGKSRLLGEATAAARRLGLGVAAGRAPITGPAPFSIVAQALRSWSRGHPLTPTRSPFDQGLRLVLPEWETPDGHAADLTAAQLRLLALEGIGLVLRQIVRAGHGALLALDDLHAADPESLEVIRYVSAAAIEGLAIVGALRGGESPLADELVRTMRTDVAATVIELDPLGRRAIGELVTSLLGAAAPDELVADVAARTDGVPLLVEEVVDAHVRAGSVDVAGGAARWRGGTVLVPRSVRGMVEARLGPLPGPQRDVLVAGAVLGQFDSARVLAAMARCDEETVRDALSRGVDVGLLATRAGLIGFRHDLIREAVLDAAVPHLVVQMHRRAAAALPGGAADVRRAAHLAAAGDDDEAAGTFAAAALAGLRAHALLGAERLARQAVGLARTGATRVRAADALAAVLAAQGRWAEALAVDEATVAESGETAGRLHRMLSAALEAGYADRARATLARTGDDLPLTRVLAGRVALVGGDAATALAEADAVLAGTADIDTRLTALDIRARALDFLGDRTAAAQAWAAQAKQAAASGRTQAELRAVFQLGKQEFFEGHGLDRLREAVELARRAGALIELAWAEETLAIALILQGGPTAALEVLDAAIPRARELRLDQLGFLLAARAGALSFTRESVDELFAEAEAVAPAPELLLSTSAVRADIAMRHGRYEEAVAHFERSIQLMTGMPGVAPIDGPCFLVWALAALGRNGEATAALRRAEAMPDLARWHPRPVIVAAGAALVDGDPAGIDAAIAAARGPMPFAIASMRVIGAQVLEGEHRIRWLREALDIYERAGATAHRDRIRSLLRDAGGSLPRRRPAPAAVPDQLARQGVTAREAEVLRLLGEGKSNADIAAALFLSVRTVETHVSSLLAKLQLRSRGQLIALSAGVAPGS